ncbi:MAG: hypothetical protein ACE367_07865 [Acidimicrobiales bacterium]
MAGASTTAPAAAAEIAAIAGDRVRVVEWPDPTIERLGYDTRSSYVERYWLPILGPSTTWLVRHLAAGLDRNPEGYGCELPGVATSLGIGNRHGRHSPFARALERAARFRLLELAAVPGVIRVRRSVPPLTNGQLRGLPDDLQRTHEELVAAELDADGARHKRACQLALMLFAAGERPDRARRHLHELGVPPRLADAALAWAHSRHRSAERAASTAATG